MKPKNQYSTSGLGMVDVSQKTVTLRRAISCATIRFESKPFQILIREGSPKGNVFETAKIAAIMAAKSTPSIIPLCHPLAIEKVAVDFQVHRVHKSVQVTVEVVSLGKTGVEMEALTAASAAVLTIYDMMKWAGQTMEITDLKLVHKSGGKSGEFNRQF